MDCGPTCLRMVAKYHGRNYNMAGIRHTSGYGREGVSLLGISDAAEKMGFQTRGVQLTVSQILYEAYLPAILHWNQNHFVVLLPPRRRGGGRRIRIADPANGISALTLEEFKQCWVSGTDENGNGVGTALLLTPSPAFYDQEGEAKTKLSWHLLLNYLRGNQWRVFQVICALGLISLIQLVLPFLTQSIVDQGINTRNLQFITIILIGQMTLIFSKSIADFIRSRLLLNISMVVNLSVLSDFWIKVTQLPIAHFDRYHTGDILQRLSDNRQLQNFLTGPVLNTLFSIVNFFVFTAVLISYNVEVFVIFLIGSVLYFAWIKLFLRIRRKLNYSTFFMSARENNATLQLVQGMQEIRLNDAQKTKRWEWENIQASIFKLNFKTLNYNQIQQAGAILLSQTKDVLITFVVAKLVIEGHLTLGSLLAVQYIIGQMNGPIEQLVSFVQSAQDAGISIERLNELHKLPNEERPDIPYVDLLPTDKTIFIRDLSFSYPGTDHQPTLNNISLEFPQGKVTAIVGASGSGKTTLLKVLLKFYEDYKGDIKIGGANLKLIGPNFWRRQCGVVLQDGYIFNDSIARNIAVGDERPDYLQLSECCRVANILSFVESLPNGFGTLLGSEGIGISQGQKQRLLIARALYKDPSYLFLDEATNSLDATNEKEIVEHLSGFFRNRTVIVIAHRLSTVKNADNIIVLENGMVIQQGTHRELITQRGRYVELVKNQLELGN